jgi:subtilisin family serine protease
MGNGTAKGGSPKARVAAYKVCYPPVDGDECFDADILAAFDAAISDGVDVLSVSLGGNPTAFFNDSVAIGSFHAVKHGIVVICSAGNSGPVDGTVSNVAPWEITVGASTMDREFPSYVVLGNKISFKVSYPFLLVPFSSLNLKRDYFDNKMSRLKTCLMILQGESLSAKALPKNKFFPLMSAADARATNASVENA